MLTGMLTTHNTPAEFVTDVIRRILTDGVSHCCCIVMARSTPIGGTVQRDIVRCIYHYH